MNFINIEGQFFDPTKIIAILDWIDHNNGHEILGTIVSLQGRAKVYIPEMTPEEARDLITAEIEKLKESKQALLMKLGEPTGHGTLAGMAVEFYES